MMNNTYNCSTIISISRVFTRCLLGFLTFLLIIFCNPSNAQKTEPKIADFGREKVKPTTQSAEITPLIIEQEVGSDTTFQVSIEQISKYYQSTRMILALKNSSNLLVNHIWFQVRLLDKNGGFLHREQPVLFTEINVNQSIRYELIFESISPEQIGYIVFRPELIELESKEYPLKESFFRLTNATAEEIQVVFNTRFQ